MKTDAGLFIWYAADNEDGDRIGTRIFVDKLLDPFTPAHIEKEVLVPTFDEEASDIRSGKLWHTVEGPFWFQEGEWQYLMYSAGAFTNDTYHIGYAVAKTIEEGVGHHSVIKIDGQYYAVYHARDIA